jgi:hypothetical protein
MVMQKALDATKGQYLLLYNYQLELLRSNPGSTVIVRRQGDTNIFQRMYICLDALKKGFKAGCRKVVGLDGCFFKGATNGELLKDHPLQRSSRLEDQPKALCSLCQHLVMPSEVSVMPMCNARMLA